jgi:hypothetical protein
VNIYELAFRIIQHSVALLLPFLQSAFSTVGLSAGGWLRCVAVAVASSALWLREESKIVTRLGTKQITAAQRQRAVKESLTLIAAGRKVSKEYTS